MLARQDADEALQLFSLSKVAAAMKNKQQEPIPECDECVLLAGPLAISRTKLIRVACRLSLAVRIFTTR